MERKTKKLIQDEAYHRTGDLIEHIESWVEQSIDINGIGTGDDATAEQEEVDYFVQQLYKQLKAQL